MDKDKAETTTEAAPPTTPTLTSVSPSTIETGSTEIVTLTVTGMDFTSNSMMVFNRDNIPTTVHSETQLSGNIDPTRITNPGTYNVTVKDGALESMPLEVVFTPPLTEEAKERKAKEAEAKRRPTVTAPPPKSPTLQPNVPVPPRAASLPDQKANEKSSKR